MCYSMSLVRYNANKQYLRSTFTGKIVSGSKSAVLVAFKGSTLISKGRKCFRMRIAQVQFKQRCSMSSRPLQIVQSSLTNVMFQVYVRYCHVLVRDRIFLMFQQGFPYFGGLAGTDGTKYRLRSNRLVLEPFAEKPIVDLASVSFCAESEANRGCLGCATHFNSSWSRNCRNRPPIIYAML